MGRREGRRSFLTTMTKYGDEKGGREGGGRERGREGQSGEKQDRYNGDDDEDVEEE